MGNQVIYQDGKFITPNKIERTPTIDQSTINFDNVFGKVQIPSARADVGDDDDRPNLKASGFSHIEYYKKEKQQDKNFSKRMLKSQGVLRSIQNSEREERIFHYAQSEIRQSKIITKPIVQSHHIQQSPISKYDSRQDSPVKDENKTPEESCVKIFESRHQSQYFKLNL